MRKISYVGLVASLMLLLTAVSPAFAAPTESKVSCMLLTGRWTDDYGYQYFLIAFGGKIFGIVKVTDCGVWIIRGNYSGSSFTFTATNPPPIEEGCTEWFTYTGTLESFSHASGTWVSSAGSSGSFTMDRGWA